MRRMRFSVECAFPHLRKRGVASRKSAVCDDGSQKSAFCNRGVTKKRTLRHSSRGAITQGAPFREERRHPPEAHSAPVDFSNAQRRSSQPTLPLDPERSRPARSPPSGSVSCTATRPRAFLSHCHSALNVPLRYDRRRVAVCDTLPLDPERSRSARSLPSGSVRRTASCVRRTARRL